jgi:hypothetical protein
MSVNSFRDLRVWQAGMDVVEQVYRLTQAFPRNELYGLSSQMQRAAVSVTANIAEGHTREHLKEYLHHLSIGYLSPAQFDVLLKSVSPLGRQLYALRNSLNRAPRHPAPDTRHPL